MEKIKLSDKKVEDDFLLLQFDCPNCPPILPGQFLMLKNKTEPILAKPFSVMSSDKNGFTMLIKVLGRFTKYLKDSFTGETFFFRGPYGIPYENKIDMSKKFILIGGGCGAAPILHFNTVYSENTEKMILGFKNEQVKGLINSDSIMGEAETGKTVLDVLRDYLSERKSDEKIQIIACGSIGMCRALDKEAKKLGLKLYVSLDERMGCGIGMCKGCPIKTKNGIQMVCKDGPLFDSDDLILDW
jgi:dihydroorotate dehydrogenase electron transfer subunit